MSLRATPAALKDPRYLPAYSLGEAAAYLGLPVATLRAWVKGQRQGSKRPFKPLLRPPARGQTVLSFVNLVEAHVLSALRREHNLPLQNIRRVLDELVHRYPSAHPLIDNQFATDGVDIFIEKFGAVANASQAWQLEMKAALSERLARIERDGAGLPIKLYPFTRGSAAHQPRAVEINPAVSFGRPVLAGTGIPTAVIASRFKAGETIDELAEDYHRSREEIEEAIRCERRERTAA